MKYHFIVLTLALLSSHAFAGFPPRTTCSNEGGTISMADGKVSILVSRHPKDQLEEFKLTDLEIVQDPISAMPAEKYGCTSRTVGFLKITLKQKSGSAMPDAYNRLAQRDGSLSDYFICAQRQAWMPAPGQSCFED